MNDRPGDFIPMKAPMPPAQPTAPDLKGALRRARLEEAERHAVLSDLRVAEISRLEGLREALVPLFAQISREIDMFDHGLVAGETPRFFVDMIAFVEIGRDRRTYRFLQDTRDGRVVLAESDKLEPIVEAITAYVARRMVAREHALAAFDAQAGSRVATAVPAATVPQAKRGSFRWGFVVGVLIGILLAAVGFVVVLADQRLLSLIGAG